MPAGVLAGLPAVCRAWFLLSACQASAGHLLGSCQALAPACRVLGDYLFIDPHDIAVVRQGGGKLGTTLEIPGVRWGGGGSQLATADTGLPCA
jgi:hypothetical protein